MKIGKKPIFIILVLVFSNVLLFLNLANMQIDVDSISETGVEILDIKIDTQYFNPTNNRFELSKGADILVDIYVKNTGTDSISWIFISWLCRSIEAGSDIETINNKDYYGWAGIPYKNNVEAIGLDGSQFFYQSIEAGTTEIFTVNIDCKGYDNGAMNIGKWYIEKITVTDNNYKKSSITPTNLDFLHCASIFNNFDRGLAYKVHAEEDLVYIAEKLGGIDIVNVSNPSDPFEVGEWSGTHGVAYGTFIEGNTAFLADKDMGLVILDITNPEVPLKLSQYNNGERCYNVEVVNDIAYVANYHEGLLILDVSDLESPQVLSSTGSPDYATDIDVFGDYAFIAARKYGLIVFDISNPSSPQQIGSYLFPGQSNYARNVFVDENTDLAYVADRECGILILDVTNPTNIQLKSRIIREIIGAMDVIIDYQYSKAYAYFTDEKVLYKYEVSNPDIPQFREAIGLMNIDSVCKPRCLFIEDSFIYVVDNNNGIRASSKYDFGDHGIWFSDGGEPRQVIVRNKIAYLADGSDGLEIIDMNDMNNPQKIGAYNYYQGEVLGIYADDNYAYLADKIKGLRILDVSEPSNPFKISQFDENGNIEICCDVKVKNDYAYVANWINGLLILDVSDPVHPTKVTAYTGIDGCIAVELSQNYAFVVDCDDGVHILDISNPTSPNLVSIIEHAGYISNIHIKDEYLYIAIRNVGMLIYDISTISSPYQVGVYDPPPALDIFDVVVKWKYAYLTIGYNGQIDIIDISDPTNPTKCNEYLSSGKSKGLYYYKGILYVANDETGLEIIDTRENYYIIPTISGTHTVFIYYLWNGNGDWAGVNPRIFFEYPHTYGDVHTGLFKFQELGINMEIAFDDSSWDLSLIDNPTIIDERKNEAMAHFGTKMNTNRWFKLTYDYGLEGGISRWNCGFDILLMVADVDSDFAAGTADSNIVNIAKSGPSTESTHWWQNIDGYVVHEISHLYGTSDYNPDNDDCHPYPVYNPYPYGAAKTDLSRWIMPCLMVYPDHWSHWIMLFPLGQIPSHLHEYIFDYKNPLAYDSWCPYCISIITTNIQFFSCLRFSSDS
ncbi:MAG: hypothetical protein FK733_19200 [Asgard group archaeon]|nr:hypothetical protein [Asgard group archaeon]